MRDRLIELIKKGKDYAKDNMNDYGIDYAYSDIADYLLANGVIVPKYKVGDKVWYITGIHRTIVKSAIVDKIIINCNGISYLFVTSDTGSFERAT